jgi:hypothetical protein
MEEWVIISAFRLVRCLITASARIDEANRGWILRRNAMLRPVMQYLNVGRWTLAGEFTEIESGKRNDRPETRESLAACKKQKAKLGHC